MRILASFIFLNLSQAFAVVVWTGAGVSVTGTTDPFDEANWILPTGITMINSNVDIDDDVLIENGNVALPQLPAQSRFQLADNRTLTVRSSEVLLQVGVNDGYGGDGGSTGIVINLEDSTNFTTFFIVNVSQMNVDATSSVTFGGPNNPINNSSVNLALGAQITFLAETPAAVQAEHFSKITVNGEAAVLGENVSLVASGGQGSVLVAIPEPSSHLLLLLTASMGFVLRRAR